MRQNTYLKIISALRAGINSKRGIQDHTGLSWGSCSPVINHLLAQGVIESESPGRQETPGKGRKSKFYSFSQQNFLLMGVEIDQKSINCCLTSMGFDPLGFHTVEFQHPITSNNLTSRIMSAYRECCRQFGIQPVNICGVSISLPGAIDVDQKLWHYSPRIPDISHFDFKPLAQSDGFTENIYIQHDIHAQANSIIPAEELKDRDYVFIHVGEGIGMSANMGEILYGSRGFAGEIGHLPYPNPGKDKICSCGKKNCYETVLNMDSVLEFINNTFSLSVDSIDEIKDREIIRQTALQYILPPLVLMATIVANIFDPRRIVIGGSVLEPFCMDLIAPFEKQLRQTAWYHGPSEICWYKAEDMNGAYGAILHSGERIVSGFLGQINLDHH